MGEVIKIGAKVVRHGRYVTFQLAEVAIPRRLFAEILRLIDGLRPRPAPATPPYEPAALTGEVSRPAGPLWHGRFAGAARPSPQSKASPTAGIRGLPPQVAILRQGGASKPARSPVLRRRLRDFPGVPAAQERVEITVAAVAATYL